MEWLLGLSAVLLLVTLVLVYLEVVDLGDLLEIVGAFIRLIAGALFAVGAFFVWMIKRLAREKRS